jgi:hypothetical protein
MDWFGWLLLGVCVLLFGYMWCANRIPPSYWYISRRKRHAMRLALQTAAHAGQEIR